MDTPTLVTARDQQAYTLHSQWTEMLTPYCASLGSNADHTEEEQAAHYLPPGEGQPDGRQHECPHLGDQPTQVPLFNV